MQLAEDRHPEGVGRACAERHHRPETSGRQDVPAPHGNVALLHEARLHQDGPQVTRLPHGHPR